MKTLATITLSLIAIIASLIVVLSTICAFSGGIAGHKASYLIFVVIALAVVAAAMSAIGKLNKKS